MPRSGNGRGGHASPTLPPHHGHGFHGHGGGDASRVSTVRAVDFNAGSVTTCAPCGMSVSFEHTNASAWAGGALLFAAVVFVVAEVRSGSRWRTVPFAARRVGAGYRATRVVTAYRTRAPFGIRAVAAACLAHASLSVLALAFAWLTFRAQGIVVAVAAIACVALAHAGVALLRRARRAGDAVRAVAAGGLLLFAPALVLGLVGLFDAPACARIGWPALVSVDAITVGIAAPFVLLALSLIGVERRHQALLDGP